MAIFIDTPESPYSEQTVTLNKRTYRLLNRWNDRFGFWAVDILNDRDEAILTGEKVMPNKDLLSRYLKDEDLGGYLFINSVTTGPVTRDNYGLDKTHTLVFATYEEVESL